MSTTMPSRTDLRDAARAAVLEALDRVFRESGLPFPKGREGALDGDLPDLFRPLDAHIDRLCSRLFEETGVYVRDDM